MRGPFVCIPIFAVLVAAACGGASSDAVPDAGTNPDAGTIPSRPAGPSGLPCDVEAVLSANCWECHSFPPAYGAPMPLMNHDDLVAPAKSDPSMKVQELGVLKTSATDNTRMPPTPREALSAAAQKTLADFSAAGAPKSTETCGTVKPPDPGLDVKCTPDLSLAPSKDWEMPADVGDEYVCWGAEIAGSPAKHIAGFVPRVDNKTIVHHIVLFEAETAYSPEPKPCNSGGSLQWRMVMGWAPGGKGLELPPDVGFPIKPGGSHYVVQMHYSNTGKLTGQKDKSGFDLCTVQPRKYEADVMAFGTQDIDIPPSSTKTMDCSVTARKELVTHDIHVIAAMPHMHKLGTAMTTTLLPAGGGAEVDLGTVKAWNFGTQAWLPINATIKAGDVVRTQCTYTNPTGAPVGFGEKTDEEMCYSFTMYWPRLQGVLGYWSWAAPAAASTCK